MRHLAAAIVFAFAASPAFANLIPPEPDHWDAVSMLEGHWRQASQDGSVNEEVWMNNKGNVVMGMSRTVKGLTNSFENLRLENTKTGVIYIARPQGAATETGFLLLVAKPDRLVFSNPANEWPQRIEYRRTGPDRLEATVSGLDPTNGKVLNFSWTRVK
jgi:Domain of unknown function (DUF6265)